MADFWCIPNLSSLPGSPAGDFDWWSAPMPDPLLMRYYPDNPNWLGAFALSENNGADRDVLFRVLKGNLGGQNYLLMQWVTRVSDNVITVDRLNCLIGVPGGPYLAFNAKLVDGSQKICGKNDPPDNAFTYKINSCAVDGMGNITVVNPADSASGDIEGTGRMWVIATTPNRNIPSKWAFQVAIPLGANWGGGAVPTPINLPASGTFKLWFEMLTSVDMGMGNPPGVVRHQWPRTAPNTADTAHTLPPVINESDLLDMSTNPAAMCKTGVTLSSANVGTHNPDGTARANAYQVKLDLGQPYPPNTGGYNTNYTPDFNGNDHSNMFFAKPTFPGGFVQAQKESIRASFSLANWGSQFSEVTAASWRPIISNQLYSDAQGEARHKWPDPNVPADVTLATTMVRNVNAYLNATFAGGPPPLGSQNPHQCMLVELTSDDPNIVIQTSSIYANMNIVSASTYRRMAEISVVGAPVLSPKPRDVYLYIQKYNMPPVVKPNDKPPGNVVGGVNLDRQPSYVSTGPPLPWDVEDLAAQVPTWTIHAYIETGKFYRLDDGTKAPILQPQTAFGYYVQHDGDLYGWETRLYGAEKLSDTCYVMRVPNNGTAHVETVIQARANASEAPLPAEGKPKPTTPGTGQGKGCPLGCLGSLLTLFGVFRR
jgi:hypothetical protein